VKTQSYLEHHNITVNNLDEAVTFIQTAMPEFEIRGEGADNQRKWAHIGTNQSYVALTETSKEVTANENYLTHGFNHMGFVVNDVELLDNDFAKLVTKAVTLLPITNTDCEITTWMLMGMNMNSSSI
jgi:hypothetical protein